MDKDLARRAHSLFMQALALDPTERASFLVASCADDITLKAHVERMLDALHRIGIIPLGTLISTQVGNTTIAIHQLQQAMK